MMKYGDLLEQRDIFRQARDSIHNIEEEVMHILPYGMREGREWVALNPTRDDNNTGSFRINITTGKWADFATGDAGGDIVSLHAYLRGISQYDAAVEMLNKRSNALAYQHKPKVSNAAKVIGVGVDGNDNSIKKDAYTEELIHKIWSKCLWSSGSPVEDYLKSRGFTSTIPYSIKYHPRLYHSATQDYYPAMVAAIFRWCDGRSLGLHRTYLKYYSNERNGNGSSGHDNGSSNSIGKADIIPNKMMLGRVFGGAVMLARPEVGNPLVIAEGIETALSVYASTGLPTWAALSTSGMINVEVPPLEVTQQIIIAADSDPAGIAAANNLANRLLKQDYSVKIATPLIAGTDFNDLLMEGNKESGAPL